MSRLALMTMAFLVYAPADWASIATGQAPPTECTKGTEDLLSARRTSDADAQALWHRFRDALADENWDEALRCCSPALQAAAERHATAEAFFRETVPVAQVVMERGFPVCGRCGLGRRPGKVGSHYELFVRLLRGGEELDVSWTFRVEMATGGWQISFPATPLSLWLQETVAVQHARYRADREAQMRLLPELVQVSTRLTLIDSNNRAGDPIFVRLELVNQSAREILYDDQQVSVNDPLSVIDEQGQPVPYALGSFMTEGGLEKLPSGQTAVLLDCLDLATLYAIPGPGNYRVQFRGGLRVGVEESSPALGDEGYVQFPCSWPSNVVCIEVVE